MVGLEERRSLARTALRRGDAAVRVAIGRALINDPHIILADEPTGNLDSVTSLMIFDHFRDLNRKGLTPVIVTHNRIWRGGRRRCTLSGMERSGSARFFHNFYSFLVRLQFHSGA